MARGRGKKSAPRRKEKKTAGDDEDIDILNAKALNDALKLSSLEATKRIKVQINIIDDHYSFIYVCLYVYICVYMCIDGSIAFGSAPSE
jgi:hypothetical protein